jgi:hypothetical protein
MKRTGLFFSLILLSALLHSMVDETESFRKFLYMHTDFCEYDNWVSHVSEGIANPGYNYYAPFDRQTNGFGDFRIPSTDELSHWGLVVASFLGGDLESADGFCNLYGFPYETVVFHNTDNGRTYYMLREHLDDSYTDDNGTYETYDDVTGSFAYGWGLYVYCPDGEPIIVTTPHPCDDFFTAPLCYEAFNLWNARYLFISGAGREVKWNNSGTYDNSKSLCDPTRNGSTPLHKAYTMVCDSIRVETGHRELSFQIHSYDWNLYPSLRDIQATTGSRYRGVLGLPIRDLSYDHHDLVNALPHIVIPANTIGLHDDVTFEDYFTTYYTDFPFYHFNSETDSAAVYNDIWLAGYPDNQQLQYTMNGVSDYELYDYFFHIEEDELPSCYPQTEYYVKWFYGFNQETGMWDYEHVYDKAIQFYMPWIQAMNTIMPSLLLPSNGVGPSTPTNLTAYNVQNSQVILQWDRSSDFDFKTYNVLYSTQPINMGDYTTYNRDNNAYLGNQGATQVTIPNLTPNTTYYFAMSAIDFQGLPSMLSNEIQVLTGPARINNFTAGRLPGAIRVAWTAVSQQDNQGFLVYRSDQPDQGYSEIANWETTPSLAGSTTPNMGYLYIDENVVPNHVYYYKVTAESQGGIVAPSNSYVGCDTGIMYQLNFSTTTGIADSVAFGMNAFASDSYEAGFDVLNSGTPPANYIDSEFYESGWGTDYDQLIQEVDYSFDVTQDYHIWTLRVRSNQTIPITIELAGLNGQTDRPGEVMFLRDGSTTTYWNLFSETPSITLSDTNYHIYYLYWGRLMPNVSISGQSNRLLKGGESVNINLNIEHRLLLSSIDVLARFTDHDAVIASGLPASSTTTAWTVPDTLTQGVHLVVRSHYPDGQVSEFVSPVVLGLVPNNYAFEFEPGWSTVANPLTSPALTYDPYALTFFGVDPDSGFAALDALPDSTGLWVYASEQSTINAMCSQFLRSSYSIPLQTGWNLIPNQMFLSFRVQDLKFSYHNYTYSYAQAFALGLIAPVAYTYHDGFRQAEQVAIGESYYIYCRTTDVSLVYQAFTQQDDLPEQPVDWRLKLTAALNGQDVDQVIVGASAYATTGFDRWFDKPEPTLKPLDHTISFAIQEDEGFGDYNTALFDQDLRTTLSSEVNDERVWPFVIHTDITATITLHVDRSEFPENHGIMVEVQGERIWLTNQNEVQFYPFNDTVTGYIHVYNQPLGGSDVVAPRPATLINAPNPFNPETTLRYYAPKAARVELNVYNIRGQKIRALVDDKLSAGAHQAVWNGRDDHNRAVATGVYFCRLSLDGKTALTRKMLLLK